LTYCRALLDRRKFLGLLAGSPLLSAWQQQLPPHPALSSAKDALDVLDFESAAREAIPPAHFGYMTTGSDDDATIRANRDGFTRIQLRARRLVDVSKVDLRTELFGTRWETPIVLAPVGSQKAFHPEGELAVGRAGNTRRTLQILSTVTTTSVEDVTQAAGHPIWYQLYPTNNPAIAEKLVRRAEAAGCPVLVFTVDNLVGRNAETQARFRLLDARDCTGCHQAGPVSYFGRKPMFDGLDVTGLAVNDPSLTWAYVDRLRRLTRMKLVVKGIVTREDALLCKEHGADGLIVSNHGGRNESSGRGTIESLPEVVDAVGSAMPVLVDGGFRRGTDIFKALALGAKAICIGRPYIWGLGAFGQAGVERVLDILRAELELTMKQCGTKSIENIGMSAIQKL
jgi:4-hydroxymandelate oxidase